jgi:hypothetical protein
MQDFLINVFPLLIPVIVILIPLVAVTGRFVIQPLVQALTRLMEAQESLRSSTPSEERIQYLEKRLEAIEGMLQPLLEEREFKRQLVSGPGRGRGPRAGTES